MTEQRPNLGRLRSRDSPSPNALSDAIPDHTFSKPHREGPSWAPRLKVGRTGPLRPTSTPPAMRWRLAARPSACAGSSNQRIRAHAAAVADNDDVADDVDTSAIGPAPASVAASGVPTMLVVVEVVGRALAVVRQTWCAIIDSVFLIRPSPGSPARPKYNGDHRRRRL